jgi:hypothetical protein
MSIVLRDTGASIDFGSRTGKSKRGVTGVKRITLDEALYLEAKHTGAVYPTMLTQPGAQVRLASSAGLEVSEQLRRIRDRGRAGKDPRLAYVEYGAPKTHCASGDCMHEVGADGCALDNRDLWWSANCALWAARITEESLEDQRNSLPPAEFMREFFSWWEDPASLGGALPYKPWGDASEPKADRGDRPVFGLELGERRAWIAVAWKRDDGTSYVMLANDGLPVPAYRAVLMCQTLAEERGGQVATAAFRDELEREGVEVLSMTASDFAAGCGLLADNILAGTVAHGNQKALNDAVKAAKWRPALTSGERAFELKEMPQVGPAAAAARALWGLENADPMPAIY